PTSSGPKSACSTGRCATGSWRAGRVCRCEPISPSSTAISNGWACSATSRCSASSRACGIATARRAISTICRSCCGTWNVRQDATVSSIRSRACSTSCTSARRASCTPSKGPVKAILLAAGRGERMRPLTDRVPKPLLRAGGASLIEWQVRRLADAGIGDIVVNVSHLAALIVAALGDGARFGVHIHYSHEPQALETAGGIVQALAQLGDSPFVAVNADIYCEYPYARLR